MSQRAKDLSDTSYGILGLLSLQDWTAYELEQQAGRSLRFISPRARSVVYAEPKRLVKLGLAEAVKQTRGQRSVAVYSITQAGRDALRAWYSTPAGFPTIEAPVLVRTLFAGGGDRDGLLAALRDCERDAGALLSALRDQAAGYQQGGPFPDRLPYIALNGIFLLGWLNWLQDWSAWAITQVENLPDDPDARRQAITLLTDLSEGRFPHDLKPNQSENH